MAQASKWRAAYDSRSELKAFGSNGLGIFALQLFFKVEDALTTAAEAITDGPDDKKADIVFVDREQHIAVIAQCYSTDKPATSAAANKASDLNTALTWYLTSPISDVPERIRPTATELRQAISDGDIKQLYVWFVHNLPESANVKNEISAVKTAAQVALKSIPKGSQVKVFAKEVGTETLEALYIETQSPILVDESFTIPITGGYKTGATSWEAFVTSIPAKFLHTQFKKHGQRLFSANVRDYLGEKKGNKDINKGIRTTLEDSSTDFWAFNNGITALVHSFKEHKTKTKHALVFSGLSIINGAQTTGSIGEASKAPVDSALVPARFIKTANSELLHDIIQFNNSQNKIVASDFRSRDAVQKRLRDEVAAIPGAQYEGGRRSSLTPKISKTKTVLPSFTVGQALAAFHGDPATAYNKKAEIWTSNNLYQRYFSEATTGRHLVFCMSLLRAVETKKLQLFEKSEGAKVAPSTKEQRLREYFVNRGATFFLVSGIALSIETISGISIQDRFAISFGSKTSPSDAMHIWAPIVEACSSLVSALGKGLQAGLRDGAAATTALENFADLMDATTDPNKQIYDAFTKTLRYEP